MKRLTKTNGGCFKYSDGPVTGWGCKIFIEACMQRGCDMPGAENFPSMGRIAKVRPAVEQPETGEVCGEFSCGYQCHMALWARNVHLLNRFTEAGSQG